MPEYRVVTAITDHQGTELVITVYDKPVADYVYEAFADLAKKKFMPAPTLQVREWKQVLYERGE
jgi:hypothetical protein